MDLLTLLCIFSGIFNVRSRPRHKDENKSRKIVFHKPKKINIQLAQFYSLKLKLCTCPREKQFTNHICQASWLSELWGVKKMSKMRHSKHRSFSNKWEVNEGQKNKLKKKKGGSHKLAHHIYITLITLTTHKHSEVSQNLSWCAS